MDNIMNFIVGDFDLIPEIVAVIRLGIVSGAFELAGSLMYVLGKAGR